MSDNTNSTNLVQSEKSGDRETSKAEAVSATQRSLVNQAMVDSWDFEDNHLAMVVWENPETIEGAPWSPLRHKLEKESNIGCSVGFAQDLYPNIEVIALFPHHVSNIPGSSDDGVVFIPYSAIRAILPLEVRLPRNAYPAALSWFGETSRLGGRNELGG